MAHLSGFGEMALSTSTAPTGIPFGYTSFDWSIGFGQIHPPPPQPPEITGGGGVLEPLVELEPLPDP